MKKLFLLSIFAALHTFTFQVSKQGISISGQPLDNNTVLFQECGVAYAQKVSVYTNNRNTPLVPMRICVQNDSEYSYVLSKNAIAGDIKRNSEAIWITNSRLAMLAMATYVIQQALLLLAPEINEYCESLSPLSLKQSLLVNGSKILSSNRSFCVTGLTALFFIGKAAVKYQNWLNKYGLNEKEPLILKPGQKEEFLLFIGKEGFKDEGIFTLEQENNSDRYVSLMVPWSQR